MVQVSSWVAFAIAAAAFVKADVSLYLPGFNPTVDMAVSANELGVDANGRTTWELVPGSPTGSFSNPVEYAVTMVAGASDMSFAFTNTIYGVGGAQYCTMASVSVNVANVPTQTLMAVCEDNIGANAATYTIAASLMDIQWTGAAAAVKRSGPSETTLVQEPTQVPKDNSAGSSSPIQSALLSGVVALVVGAQLL